MQVTRPALMQNLRVFSIAARHLSFKAAADVLFLTPSAVSHRIKDLERDLEAPLFVRRTRAVELTATGRRLLEEIEPILGALDQAVNRVSERSARRSLRVTVPPFFASEMFIPRLSSFYGLAPRVDLHLRSDESHPTEHAGGADVSILISDREPRGVIAHRLFAPRLVAATSRARALVARELGPKLFQTQVLIVHKDRATAWAQWAANSGFADAAPRRVIELDSMLAVARAAEQGLGIALLPTPLCESWFRSGKLARISEVEVDTGDAYYLAFRADDGGRTEVRALASWALTEFRR